MSPSPKVSIVIPSYNHARFLPAAIESALAQTFRDIEVVVVDDGSSDDSLQIAESYAARHPALVRVFTHPGGGNRGASATVNRAFAMARGEYLSGLPSDDMLHADKVERQVDFLEANPACGLVYGVAEYVGEDGEPLPERGRAGVDVTRDPNPVDTMLRGNAVFGQTVLLRRECVEQVGDHDTTLAYGDWDFWVRCLANWKAGFIGEPLVKFRVHTYNSSIGIRAEAHLRSWLEVMLALRRKAPDVGGFLDNPRTRALLDLQLTLIHFFLRDEDAAALSLAQAFETDAGLRDDVGYVGNWLGTMWRYLPEEFRHIATEHDFARWAIRHLPAELGDRFARDLSAHYHAQAARHYSSNGDRRRARRMVITCFRDFPSSVADGSLLYVFGESLVGPAAMSRARRIKRRLSGGGDD